MSDNVGTHPGASEYSGNPQRKSPRAIFHDYSAGDYFVTICTQNKDHFFGEIENDEILYTELGLVTCEKLEHLASHYQYVDVPVFAVMPNHVHAIIRIHEPSDAPGCVPTQRTALSVVIGGFKQSVTMYARRNNISFDWQERYHDHIIRNRHDGNNIARYIETNVQRWNSDCFHPKRR